jgi:hypothetical protein
MEEPCFDKTNVPCCKEIGHWKNECPRCTGPMSEPNKTAPGKTGWQPEPEAQDLIGLAGIGSD